MSTKNDLDQNSATQRNQKFKYLTTNMQNLLKNFNENLSVRKPDSRLELLNRLKQHQLSQQPVRALVRSKTMTSRADRPLSHLEPCQEKPKINRSQSQLNYHSLHRTEDTFDHGQSTEDRIHKSKSSQQIQMNSSLMSDSYHSDSEFSSQSNSPKKTDTKRRSSSILIDNPKSVVLRRDRTTNDTDLPMMKQKLLAGIKRGQSLAPPSREESSVKRIAELEDRILALESELDRERKKLAVEREEKYELVNEIKMRYESEKVSALKALEAKLNAGKLIEINGIRESLETESREEIEQNKKYFENEVVNLKNRLQEKNERCFQLEKLLKDEHLKSERLFLKSIELVRKLGQKSNRESLCSNELQTEHSSDQMRQRLGTIRQILSEEDESQEPKSLPSTDELIHDIEIRSRRIKQQNQTNCLDIKILKETKLKLESLYKIKCKSDLNKSAKIHKLEINYQSELLKLRNEFNSDLVRYLEHKLVLRDALLNDLVLKLSKILNILNISDEPCEMIRANLDHLVQNLTNSLNLSEPSLQVLGEVTSASFNLDTMYKKAPVSLVAKGVDINPDCIVRKIDHDESPDKERLERTIQDELLELDKHLNNMKLLSNSLTEQTLNKGLLKPVRASVSKSSSNCSSCDISNSSHSFIELEEASDVKFGEKPNINLVAHKTYKKKPNYELIVQ